MTLSVIDSAATILASDGSARYRLRLRQPPTGGPPVLVDAAGTVFHPWEVEVRRWPPEAETDLRRGGYLPGRSTDMELWCNCAD